MIEESQVTRLTISVGLIEENAVIEIVIRVIHAVLLIRH